jgi:hypothetical protein
MEWGGEGRQTALFDAVERSDLELVRLLLDRRAERDEDAFYHACEQSNTAFLDVLYVPGFENLVNHKLDFEDVAGLQWFLDHGVDADANCCLHRPRAVAQVAPDLTQHGRHGVAGECDVAAEVEAIDRLQEPQAGDLEEIVNRLPGVLVAARQGAREGQEALHEHVTVDRVASLQVALKQRAVGAQAPRATPSLGHLGTHLPFLEARRRFTATKGPGGRVDRGCGVSAQGLLALCGGSRGEQSERPTGASAGPASLNRRP